MATSDNISADILSQCLQGIYPRIVTSFDPKGFILDSLFAKNTITLKEKRRIAGLPAEERAAELLDTMLDCNRPNAIVQFLEILSNDDKTSCKWIHDEVHKAARQKLASSLENEISSDPMKQDREDVQSKNPGNGEYQKSRPKNTCRIGVCWTYTSNKEYT